MEFAAVTLGSNRQHYLNQTPCIIDEEIETQISSQSQRPACTAESHKYAFIHSLCFSEFTYICQSEYKPQQF